MTEEVWTSYGEKVYLPSFWCLICMTRCGAGCWCLWLVLSCWWESSVRGWGQACMDSHSTTLHYALMCQYVSNSEHVLKYSAILDKLRAAFGCRQWGLTGPLFPICLRFFGNIFSEICCANCFWANFFRGFFWGANFFGVNFFRVY